MPNSLNNNYASPTPTPLACLSFTRRTLPLLFAFLSSLPHKFTTLPLSTVNRLRVDPCKLVLENDEEILPPIVLVICYGLTNSTSFHIVHPYPSHPSY